MEEAQRKSALNFVEWGAKLMVWVAGGALIITSFVVTIETLLRKFAGFSFGGVHEISAYVFAISSSWAFGWTLMRGAHIRISALRDQFGPHVRGALDVLAWIAFLLVFSAIAYRAAELAWESYITEARAPTPSRTLLFIPQMLWAFGFAGVVLAALRLGFRVIGERSTSSLAPMDEVEVELEHLK